MCSMWQSSHSVAFKQLLQTQVFGKRRLGTRVQSQGRKRFLYIAYTPVIINYIKIGTQQPVYNHRFKKKYTKKEKKNGINNRKRKQ